MPKWFRTAIDMATAVAIVMLAKTAVAEPFYVPSGSMEPTLLIGDALLASKYPYGYSSASLPVPIAFEPGARLLGALPERGDVVVFRLPRDPSQVWVKRVIALPGDRVQMRGGQIWLNGAPFDVRADGTGTSEDEFGDKTPATRFVETLPGGRAHTIFKIGHNTLDDTREIVVPQDRLFVMGDNRDQSADSRLSAADGGVGLLPVENLVGRVDALVGSWDLGMKRQPIWEWASGFRFARFFTAVR
jgi:signal peptidase I